MIKGPRNFGLPKTLIRHSAHAEQITVDKIRDFRRVNGFSQQELADAIGVNRGYLGAVEQGKRAISLDVERECNLFFAFFRQAQADGQL